MRILEVEQGSPEWYQARLGVPTASEFSSIITPKRGEYAAAADTYINQLIDELMRPQAGESFGGNRHTQRGKDLEPDARELYAFDRDVVPRQVGFILNDAGTLGCSPDSMIDLDGGLEIKCPDGPTHVKWVRAGIVPEEHKPQVHGSLIITGRAWWDFMSHCPGYEPLIVRVTPDDFTKKLQAHLDRFLIEYQAARAKFIKEAA
ncbi:lambda exonuclease family protein [Stenotrophomonas tumulicola]|uniref:YqaJ viral recombinase family protein n=1 Tax=Stenotrophomonas tumulicola TaxID=1685415 RepID=A0A7W3IG28_9GAMM|nr:lambda exonuclease family protein [Stenotrophomonas tumulicola]MBA8680480.1 YqaJ viral recombinase family protein [Stenotrophomonas tumulicola]